MSTNNSIIKWRKSFDIVKGPGRDALIDAFKYAYDKESKVDVDFKVALCYTAPPSDSKAAYVAAKIKNLRIVGIEHESGDCDGYNIFGFCDADLRSHAEGENFSHYRFEAHYNAKRRTGRMSFFQY